MATRTIACADCGQPYATKRKNTKYCRVCRLLRNIDYLERRTYTCEICDREYAPLQQVNKDWLVCGRCASGWADDTKGTCAICEQESDQLLHPDIAVCRECAFDPEKRLVFYKALRRKQRERKDRVN